MVNIAGLEPYSEGIGQMVIKILIALLLIASPCFGTVQQIKNVVTMAKSSGGSSCGSLTFSGTPGDAETFENSEGSFCTGSSFTETDPTSIISTYSAAQYKNGTHSAYFAFTGGESNVNFLRADFGATDTNFTLSFWLRVASQSAWNNETIFTLSEHASSPSTGTYNALTTMVSDQDGGSNFKIRIYEYSAGGSTLGTVNYPVGAWIMLQYEFRSAGSSDVKIYNISNTLQETINIAASPARSIQYAYWGEISGANQAAIRPFYIDDVQYNSTNP